MHVVKSIGVLSVAKIMGLIYLCLGLLFIPFFLFFGLVGLIAGQDKTPFVGVIGVVFAILMPLVYGAMGFITGAIGALLYNVFAKMVGGFELTLEQRPLSPAPYPLVPPATPAA